MTARRLIPLGAVVAALLVVAAIASHGRPLSTHRGTGPDATFFDYVATTLILLGAAAVVVIVWALLTQRLERSRVGRSRWDFLSAIVLALLCGLMAVLIAKSRPARVHYGRGLPCPTCPTSTPAQRKHLKGVPRNARIRWDEVAIVLALAAGVGLYFFFTRTPRRELLPLVRRRQAAVARAVDDSLDDLRNDPDVRRAIVAAYARMERALGVAGMPRAPAEAPFEYFGRALVELEAGAEPARRLTGLFERAKFSHHELGEPMRNEAIDALVAVRDALVRPEPAPVAG